MMALALSKTAARKFSISSSSGGQLHCEWGFHFMAHWSRSVLSGRRRLEYRNSNSLVRNDSWEIGLQKTGYIREAGRCLVMQVSIAQRNLIMVFLDSNGKYTRLADAKRIRKWLESEEQKAKQAANQSPKHG